MVAIIPMAGRGSRYATQGYDIPKPLISVANKPMILWALKSLEGLAISKYIFVALEEHEREFHLTELLTKQIKGKLHFVFLKDVTEGQLCTALAAKKLLNDREAVLIASSDTLVVGDLAQDISLNSWDGIISVSNLPGQQWSFARINGEGQVVEVAEKRRISDHASTGLYYFKHAEYLIEYGEKMIQNNERTRGEFYVIPVYQKMIEASMRIGISRVREMWDMGTPEAKSQFEKYLSGCE